MEYSSCSSYIGDKQQQIYKVSNDSKFEFLYGIQIIFIKYLHKLVRLFFYL